VDVNVHPTKSEVHFLDEEQIIEVIASNVQRILAERSSKSREYDVHKQVCVAWHI
jgi:DNA mismatch repair protein MLH1